MERWSWLGDDLALDVANTVQLHRRGYVDLLRGPEDLAEWSRHQTGRVPVDLDHHRFTAEDVSRFRTVRDHVLALLRATAAGEDLPQEAASAVNAVARATPVLRRLTPAATAEPELLLDGNPLTGLLGLTAAAMIQLITGPDRSRLALCPAPSCGQLYLRDRTNQQWCGNACGNRARGARHQAHRRAVQ